MRDPGSQRPVARTVPAGGPRTAEPARDPGSQRPVARTVPAGDPRTAEAARIIVTGASGAIGAATADALRRRGAWVVGIDRTPGEDVIAADLCDGEAVARAVGEAISRL